MFLLRTSGSTRSNFTRAAREGNREIFLSHLKCAAFELPIKEGEAFGKHNTAKLCQYLAEDLRVLHCSGDCWHWVHDSYPADSVSLRAVTSDNFLVVDITDDHRIIGEVDFSSALTTLHEKAIYLHDARQYQVENLDFDGRKAFVRQVDSDYFTDAIVYTQVSELSQFENALAIENTDAQALGGEVRVKRQVVGFKKIKFCTLENIGAGVLSLPEQETWFYTTIIPAELGKATRCSAAAANCSPQHLNW